MLILQTVRIQRQVELLNPFLCLMYTIRQSQGLNFLHILITRNGLWRPTTVVVVQILMIKCNGFVLRI